jgi:hypothetical protein
MNNQFSSLKNLYLFLTTREFSLERLQKTPDEAARKHINGVALTKTSLSYDQSCMKGTMWMADDCDAPLEDFEEYFLYITQD